MAATERASSAEQPPTRSRRRDVAGASARSARPRALTMYLVGAVFLCASALVGGIKLMQNPRDDPLGMPMEWLEDTPFEDYFLPGLTLFTVFGLGSIGVLFGIVRRRAWAGLAAIGLGLAQVVWIAVEMALLRAIHPLHVLYGGLGAALAWLASRPAVRRYLSAADDDPADGLY